MDIVALSSWYSNVFRSNSKSINTIFVFVKKKSSALLFKDYILTPIPYNSYNLLCGFFFQCSDDSGNFMALKVTYFARLK